LGLRPSNATARLFFHPFLYPLEGGKGPEGRLKNTFPVKRYREAAFGKSISLTANVKKKCFFQGSIWPAPEAKSFSGRIPFTGNFFLGLKEREFFKNLRIS
jgi:hypothetical protein